MLMMRPPRFCTASRTRAKSHTMFAPPMRVSAGLLPNMTTRSLARSASVMELALVASYGLNAVAGTPSVLWLPSSSRLSELPYMYVMTHCSMCVE